MRVTHLNLPKDHIGLTKLQGLQLKIGDLLPALVLKTGPEHALLLIKGKQVLAEVKTHLQPGEELKVRVAGEFQNKVILKVLTELGTANPSPVEQLLKQAGGRSESDARSALTFLLRNGLPVTSDTLRAAVRDQQKPLDQILAKVFATTVPSNAGDEQALPTGSGRAAETTAGPVPDGGQPDQQADGTALQRGSEQGRTGTLPRETPTASNTGRIPSETVGRDASPSRSGEAHSPSEMTGKGNAAANHSADALVSRGGRAVRSHDPNVRADAHRSSVDPRLPIDPNRPGADAANRSRTDAKQAGVEATARQISDVVRSMVEQKAGLERDTRSQSAIPRPHSELPRSTAQTGGNPGVRTGNVQTGNTSHTQVTLPTQANMTSISPGERLVQLGLALNPERSVSELAAGLKKLARHLGLAPSKEPESASTERQNLASLLPNPLGDEAKEGLHELAEKMLGLRLHQQEENVLLHMEIPLFFQGQLTSARLQVREDEHRPDEMGEKPLSILFNLKTDLLGHLKVMALLEKEAITCQFSSDRETTRMLLRQTLPELKERFEAISYQVNHMGVLPLVEEEPEEKIEPLPGQVDFRV